jgi:hypothetical protein
MTIRRGETWGQVVQRPDVIQNANSDAALAQIVGEHLAEADRSRPGLCVTSGDLARTLGTHAPTTATTLRSVPIDLVRARFSGVEALAVAHVVLRRRWRLGVTGPVHLICNAEYYRGLDIAPRAHPNDGLADLLEVDSAMGLRQRLLARRRAATGTHLPHPGLRMRRVASGLIEPDERLGVWIDGVYRGSTNRLEFAIVPDAVEILLG